MSSHPAGNLATFNRRNVVSHFEPMPFRPTGGFITAGFYFESRVQKQSVLGLEPNKNGDNGFSPSGLFGMEGDPHFLLTGIIGNVKKYEIQIFSIFDCRFFLIRFLSSFAQ